MISRRFLKEKLQRVSAKKRKFRPKTREEVLRALEVVESVISCGCNAWEGEYFVEQLEILCERTRTALQMEVAQESLCKTCAHYYRSIMDYPCNVCDRDIPEKNMWEAK